MNQEYRDKLIDRLAEARRELRISERYCGGASELARDRARVEAIELKIWNLEHDPITGRRKY